MTVGIRTKVTGVSVDKGVACLKTNAGDITFPASPLSFHLDYSCQIIPLLGQEVEIQIKKVYTPKDPNE